MHGACHTCIPLFIQLFFTSTKAATARNKQVGKAKVMRARLMWAYQLGIAHVEMYGETYIIVKEIVNTPNC